MNDPKSRKPTSIYIVAATLFASLWILLLGMMLLIKGSHVSMGMVLITVTILASFITALYFVGRWALLKYGGPSINGNDDHRSGL